MTETQASQRLAAQRLLSPLRNSTLFSNSADLAREQLAHFGLDPSSEFGCSVEALARRLYECQADVDQVWKLGLASMGDLSHADRIARFNAQKFLSFQIAKLLDTLQNSFRASYQSFEYSLSTQAAKGPYAIFDNVTAIFSAAPVIARTATYVYACAEWIADAFQGKELMHEIYSRLLNPTSVSLANYVVDLEAGPYTREYFAWNFNSGMAAIDACLSNLLGRDDILITSRNIYGGAHQLIHDWFAKPGNLAIAVESFDGLDADAFEECLNRAKEKYADRLNSGRKIYLYLESPCNPHGDILDVPAICKGAHAQGIRVMLDATVGTPFLSRPLQRTDASERPDFVIHSYTKDLSGTGSIIGGAVIGRNEDMFVPKGATVAGVPWNETMFWNVYYVKGAFLSADAAYEIIQGMRTLDVRMMAKCINTHILARFLAEHPSISVNCSSIEGRPSAKLREDLHFLGLPAPLFTIDMGRLPKLAFQRFFDSLEPAFSHMISLGQSNTIVSCPALTTHSELDDAALRDAGITPTTIRFAMGDEDPLELMDHFVDAAKLAIDPESPGFSAQFPSPPARQSLVRRVYLDAHTRFIDERLSRAASV
jgi:O-acetylhomoserine (thiol)-lyase